MLTIFKYPVPVMDTFTIRMPEDAKIISVHTQKDNPCIWALVEDENDLVDHVFSLGGTGHDMSDLAEYENTDFVGSFFVHGENLVFHLFYCGEAKEEVENND